MTLVGGAAGIDQTIRRQGVAFRLKILLQATLEILILPGRGLSQQRCEQRQSHRTGRLITTIAEDRADQRLHGISQQACLFPPATAFLTPAKHQESTQVKLSGQAGQAGQSDHLSTQSGKGALIGSGHGRHQRFADHQIKDCIAEEFQPFVVSGGIGARFWPMSRSSHPKQFIDILGTGKTLIQQTFERLTKLCPPENILVVTNGIYKELVLGQLPDISEEQILCEPMRRNTAPCIAYANYKIMQKNPDACVVVAPSDHIILKEEEFIRTLQSTLKAASENDWLLTLGITPSRPDTGYGYIQYTDETIYSGDEKIKKVKTFTEKPNLELAETFLQSGDFLWNSGIFIWSLKSIMESFKENLPEVDELFEKGIGTYNTPEEENFINQTYSVCRNISIDYGVMEKAGNVYVRISDFGWSDLGTWGSLHDIREKDDMQNAVTGKNVMLYNTEDCIINVPRDKLVVINGISDCIIVEEEGALLICKKSDEQQIRQIVNDVRIEKGEKFV